MSLYCTDFAAWVEEQAGLLRARTSNELDWENLAEEIASLSRNEHREVRQRLRLICQHLLTWAYQPEHQSRSWRNTIETQRRDLEDDVLSESPSLRPYAASVLAPSYTKGRGAAERETGLLHLPEQCPWTIAQVLDPDFWP
jgi:hypothetical protein